MIDLSVVIPTYQRCQSLRQVLSACEQQTLAPDRYEIIVTIDGSTDDTEAMLRRLIVPYRLRWTTGPNSGPGAARNRGAALAQGKVILFLDDDIVLTRPSLAAHLRVHQDGVDRVCLGQVRGWRERRLSSWEGYLNQRYEEHYQKMEQPDYRPDYWDCLSGNMSMPRSLFVAGGGFDHTFAAAKHDDIEFGFRLAALGAKFVYQRQALGYHNFVKSVEDGLRDALTNGASAVRLVHFHPDLRPSPVVSVWHHYPAMMRVWLRCLWQRPNRQAHVTAWSRRMLHWVVGSRLPVWAQRPFFRLAYQLHFWQGVRSEANPAEWQAILKSDRARRTHKVPVCDGIW